MSEMKEVKWYTDQEIFDCLDIHHMCRGPYVLTSDYDALLSEKAALARDRDAHRDALQDIFVDVERYCRERDRLRDEVRHLRTAIAAARKAIELALRCIDGHTPVDYCPERVRHNNAKDQLRALSSIGDLTAGEEG